MPIFTKRTRENAALVDLLNQILKLEYSLIVSYPRLARRIKDLETKALAISLGTASIKHADIVANASSRFGGYSISHFGIVPEDRDLLDIFTEQLEKEKQALMLHQQCAALTKEEELKFEFTGMANEEKAHIKTAERIISNLKRGADRKELSPSLVRSPRQPWG